MEKVEFPIEFRKAIKCMRYAVFIVFMTSETGRFLVTFYVAPFVDLSRRAIQSSRHLCSS